MEVDKTVIRDLYKRVCRDSGYQLSTNNAIILVANVLNINKWDVYNSFGDFKAMDKIAAGDIK